MGVKVDRNDRVVLDLEAIWMICFRLDISMNHRSPATATFKAQLVSETPAIEMEKKCVFEQDRSLETLDQFLGFEKIAVVIGPPMSITCPVKNLTANKHGFFGGKFPMAPAARCSLALQSRSSAVERVGFNRAMQVFKITAGPGGLTSASTLGLDSNVTMKAGDSAALLPDLGLCVLRARLERRNFSEVPGVCPSYMVPLQQEVMVKGYWRQLCAEKPAQAKKLRMSWFSNQVFVGPLHFRAVEADARPRASAWSPSKAGDFGVLLAHKPFRTWGAELESSRDFFEALMLYSAWLVGLRENRSDEPPAILYPDALAMVDVKQAMVKGNWRQPFSAEQARSPSESLWKKCQMTPPAARCSFALLSKSFAVELGDFRAQNLSEFSWKNSSMTPHASRCSFALLSKSFGVELGDSRAMLAWVNTTRAVSGRLTSGSTPGLDSNATKAGSLGSLLAELGLDVLRARLERRKFSEVPRVCQAWMLPMPLKVVKDVKGKVKVKWRQPFSAQEARNPFESSWKKKSITLPASRCSFALQNRSRAVERADFRAMQAVVNTTRAVSGGLTGVSTPGLDSNVTMKAGDGGALLPDLGLCALRARLERRHFSEVPRACQSCMLPIPLKADTRLPRPLAWLKKVEVLRACVPCTLFQPLKVTLQGHWKQPFSVKQAIIPALDREIWPTTSMSRFCSVSFVVVRNEESEERAEILKATDSVFRPMSWSRRLKALDSDSQLCGPPAPCAQRDSLHLNDVWSPLKRAESAEPSEDLSCRELPPRTDLAMEEDVRKVQVELRKGCRLLTMQSRERYPLHAAGRSTTARRMQRTKRRMEVHCDVEEKTGRAKLLAFSGALRMGHRTLTLAGMELAGWPHDSFSQLDVGDKLGLQNPFESVLIETGAVLQHCEPEELVVLTLSYGGNSGYRLASHIERATGRAVRGVVMWDFITPFGRGLQGPPLLETPAFKSADVSSSGIEVYAQLASASPDFRCRCGHPIQMVAGFKTGEKAIDLLMDRQRAESAIKVMYKKLQIEKVEECHFGYESTNWDMLRLILSTRRPKNTADAATDSD